MERLWDPDMNHFKVIVIDSLASLFLPLLGDSFNDGIIMNVSSQLFLQFILIVFFSAISLLNKVASDLKGLTIENRCLVLIINNMSNGPTDTPLLGRYWLHVPNLRLQSKRLSDDEFHLSVVRNVYGAVQDKFIFRLPRSE